MRARYKTLKEKGASASEINEVVRTIKEVDSKYYELDNAILASRTNKAARVKSNKRPTVNRKSNQQYWILI